MGSVKVSHDQNQKSLANDNICGSIMLFEYLFAMQKWIFEDQF